MLLKIIQNKKIIPIILLLTVIIVGSFLYFKKPKLTELEKQGEVGDFILNNDFAQKPIIPIQPNENTYQLTDSLINGPTIQYANPPEEEKDKPKKELGIEFPKNYQEPIHIKLDEQRFITIQDNKGENYNSKLITEEIPLINNEELRIKNDELINNEENPKDPSNRTVGQESDRTLEQTQSVSYLKYQSKDKRKSIYYAYQKDSQERTLKHWTIYDKPKKENKNLIGEKEIYQISNAKLKLNEDGQIEVYYFGEQDIQNEQVKAEVDNDLMARAQRTLQKELGEDILNTDNHTPDFIIPQPYYINQKREEINLVWELNQETNEISISFNPKEDDYPIAMDPTIQFTAPGQESSGDVIAADPVNTYFGVSMASGDFNADSRTDLVVSSTNYNNGTGKIYIFYNDGTIPTTAVTADVTIIGETISNYFGISILDWDYNEDGKADLLVGAYGYGGSTGRVYVFYSDGAYPATATDADMIITGETTGSYFGYSMTSGDFNTDGKIDLAVGAYAYSSSTGRVYIFYNDGNIPNNAVAADAFITGETTSNYFSFSITSGDFNADGRMDLALGAYRYSTYIGRVYIFYNDGSYPVTATDADVIITGEGSGSTFGYSMTSGDFNADGRNDLAVGAYFYLNYNYTGRAYIFYNDGTFPSSATAADATITGQGTSNYFGYSMTSGDFNYDGKTDLAVGAYYYSTRDGRSYIFYNDGTYTDLAANADVIIGGETDSYFGISMASGDFNADGRVDLAIGAYQYSSGIGRTYILYNDGSIPTSATSANVIITGEIFNGSFGIAMTSGDFNFDGKVDLAVGASGYSSSTGRVYLFYNDGDIPQTDNTADVIITGGTTSNYFGYAMTSGDFNFDGRVDLAVGAYGYTTNTGRAYIFYNDGSIPTTAGTANVTITGETTSNYFGYSMTSGDFNYDGRTDLAIGAYAYSSATGRAYIFYNDGTIPTAANAADVIITGENTNSYFGQSMTSGDFNADGRTDLAIGAYAYSSSTGRVYIFYNDGTYSSSATDADVIITGENFSNYFGYSMTSGDFNHDGRTDLAVGAYAYSSSTGRVYIFYNDGTYSSSATDADVIITGETTSNYFGYSMTSGDFDADGRVDLAVGAYYYSSYTGRAYIFYNDGSMSTAAASADVIITGESTSDYFGISMISGDFNADGKTDLAVGAYGYDLGRTYIFYSQDGQLVSADNIKESYSSLNAQIGYSLTSGDFNADGRTDLAVGSYYYSSYTGRVYIFYNDGDISPLAVGADVTITGENISDYFSYSMTSGDFNFDGRIDLAVGAYNYLSSDDTGRAYIFYNDGIYTNLASLADVIITGEMIDNYFGISMTSGDFNADGRTDLAVGAYYYSSYTGRAYIFYNDGIYPSSATDADVKITGETTYNYFGLSMTSGDFNNDSRVDLAVGACRYGSNRVGRAYIFYNDGTYTNLASSADVVITGALGPNGGDDSYFGCSMTNGDFNFDGRTDLAVGAYYYDANYTNGYDNGAAFIFYNDGTYTNLASSADVIITGENFSDYFGHSMTSGDLNADGKTDLIVGAYYYNGGYEIGRAYIFYNDGTYTNLASSADVIITGEATAYSRFGFSMTTGDFNYDGRTDLAVGAYYYSSSGRVYIFYNDGTYPSAAADADIKITGDDYGSYFGYSMTSGDFNNDSRLDLAVGAYGDYGGRGKVYLFYNDGSMPTSPDTADFSITGESFENFFGYTLSSGDINNDSQTDLIVGAKGYDTNTGRVYIIYNDGTYPALAADSDIKIDGENDNDNFGYTITVGDIIGDSKIDLIVGANGYSTNTGRIYIFNNDGTIPTTASSADTIITGQNANDYFGSSLITGDFDYDMDNDLIVGAYGYNTNTGRAYIFNNDNNYPASAADSDIKIDGELFGEYFGNAFTKGDFNADNREDIAIGAYGYGGYTGRVAIFYNDGTITTNISNADKIIVGENSSNSFGYALSSGDFNADKKTDLAVGAYVYSSSGRAYMFYNDGSIPTLALNADMKISALQSSISFARSILGGDFNSNRKDDLCIGYNGGFSIYEVDAEGTSPDYIQNNGTVRYNGSVLLK